MEVLIAVVVLVVVAAVVAFLVARSRGGGVIALPKDARRPGNPSRGPEDPPAKS